MRPVECGIFEHLPVAATLVDARGWILKANAEARRLAGAPRARQTCRQYWRCRVAPGRCTLHKALTRGAVRRAKVPQGGPHGCAIERISVFKGAGGKRLAVILTGPATTYFKRLGDLRRDARLDGLSHVLNRRSFDMLAAHAQNAERRRQPAAFLMADIDGLKGVNDRFGHAAGDDLIERLGRVMSACARRGDIVGRVGGDEFAVYCPGAARADAQGLARRIKRALRMDNAAHAGRPPLSAQIGVAFSRGPGRDALREAADRGLRRLKSARRRSRSR